MNQPGNEASAVQASPLWKRVLDVSLILCASPLLLSVTVSISLWILLVSGRPVLFRQQRIGLHGRPFMCYKFRTMRVGADTKSHENHAQNLIDSGKPMAKLDLQGDPRLIPFALAIRSSGLDELPQLINVLRGEMSLVGPRPCLPCEYEKYQAWQRERFGAIPGLTGLWQVSGKNKTTFVKMVELDIQYGRNRSLGLDLFIILKTVPALLGQIFDVRRNTKEERRAEILNPPGEGKEGITTNKHIEKTRT